MLNLPELKDVPFTNLYTPNVRPSSWAAFLLRNVDKSKIFALRSVSSETSDRAGLLLTWPAAEAAAIQHKSNPSLALAAGIKDGSIAHIRRMSQKVAYDFAKQPQKGVACIVTRRYYDEPIGLILPMDVVEKLRAA